jgi:hypothetical protein
MTALDRRRRRGAFRTVENDANCITINADDLEFGARGWRLHNHGFWFAVDLLQTCRPAGMCWLDGSVGMQVRIRASCPPASQY